MTRPADPFALLAAAGLGPYLLLAATFLAGVFVGAFYRRRQRADDAAVIAEQHRVMAYTDRRLRIAEALLAFHGTRIAPGREYQDNGCWVAETVPRTVGDYEKNIDAVFAELDEGR